MSDRSTISGRRLIRLSSYLGPFLKRPSFCRATRQTQWIATTRGSHARICRRYGSMATKIEEDRKHLDATAYHHITHLFKEVGPKVRTLKMATWEIYGNKGGAMLGKVEFLRPEKGFCFWPGRARWPMGSSCLLEVSDFIWRIECRCQKRKEENRKRAKKTNTPSGHEPTETPI